MINELWARISRLDAAEILRHRHGRDGQLGRFVEEGKVIVGEAHHHAIVEILVHIGAQVLMIVGAKVVAPIEI